MQNSIVVFTFSVLDGDTLFGQFWSIKSELSVQAEIWHPEQHEYAVFNDAVHFFRFRPEIPFLGKFGLKNQNCQFKVKSDTSTNSNMQNSMAVFTFSVLERKYPFRTNLGQKVKIVSSS